MSNEACNVTYPGLTVDSVRISQRDYQSLNVCRQLWGCHVYAMVKIYTTKTLKTARGRTESQHSVVAATVMVRVDVYSNERGEGCKTRRAAREGETTWNGSWKVTNTHKGHGFTRHRWDFFKLDLKDFRRSQCANVDVHVGGTSLTFFKMISRLLNYVGVKKSKEKKTKQRNHMIHVWSPVK